MNYFFLPIKSLTTPTTTIHTSLPSTPLKAFPSKQLLSSTPNTKSSLQSYVRQLSFTDDTSTSSVTPTQDHNDPTQRTQLIQTSIKIFCHKTMT
jgi:hypothetical protein